MTYRQLLHNRPYMLTLFSYGFSRLGDSIDLLVTSWLIYQLSHSASASALAVGINYLPTILLQPLAGALVERIPKKWILAGSDAGRCTLSLAALGLLTAGRLTTPILLLFTFLVSCLEAFRNPATIGALPRVLPQSAYDSGISLFQATGRVVELAGTGAAGILSALGGVPGMLAADVACFFLSSLLIFPARFASGDVRDIPPSGVCAWFSLLREGFVYLGVSRSMLVLAGLGAFLNLALTPFNALQSVLVSQVWNRGPKTLSFLNLSLSAGMLAGAFFYPSLSRKITIDKALFLCGILNGGYYLIQEGIKALSGAGLFFFAALGISGVFFGLSIGFVNTAVSVLLVRCVPANLLSRQSALVNALCTAAVPAASFALTPLAAWFSPVALMGAFGAGIVAVMIAAKRCGIFRYLEEST